MAVTRPASLFDTILMYAQPAAIDLATGSLLLVLAMSVATCRIDKLVQPGVHDRLVVSPVSVLDSAHAGSRVDVIAMLRLTSADGATLVWNATATAPWLTLSTGSGGAPDSVVATLRADTLSQVIHHDTIVFTAMQSPGDTLKVPVAFAILAPAAELTVSPQSRLDSAFAGSAQPHTFVLRIDNTGGLPLKWKGGVDGPWLTLSADSGGAPPQDSTTVSLTPSALGQGMQTGTVTITAPGAIGSPRTVTVSFKIKPCAEPAITADTVVNASIALADCGAPDRAGSLAKRYSLTANAGDTLSFRLSSPSFNAYLTLHDSLGTLLSQNDDCPGYTGPSCILEFPAPASGRYVIEATSVGTPDTGAFVLSVVRERAPSLPQSIGQFRSDSTTSIGIGATTPESVAVFKGTLNDPNLRDSVRLELELVQSSSPFSGSATHQSSFVGVGQTAWIRTTGLVENVGYHWRARTCDKTLRCSAWLSFGGNPDAASDFFVNAIPEDPAIDAFSLNQFNGAVAIPVGGGTGGGLGSAQTVTFKATVTDPDPGDVVVLEVESQTTNTAFDGSTNLYRGTGVASGSTATAAAGYSVGLLGANYHWRARACDQTSRCSPWVSFGGNSDVVTAATDFHVP
ncbi:MAG TPA: pre-peptidase C-terminal domain-containing protein [Gemmatimonadales bacterium]|nr:pre-peptidase C-terminal domain-containing protein [Gemmatimonadales bacterium]